MAKKNLVITAAFGFGIDQLELFVKSLRRFYFDDICFFIGNEDIKIEEELKKYNCICIKNKINKKDIQLKRYQLFYNFLKERSYENILCCDSRDIYFQTNPFDYQFNNEINFFQEDKALQDCPYNSNWIIKCYGEKNFKNIKDKTILCSGTVLGKKEKILEYLSLMNQNITRYKYKKSFKYFITLRRDPAGRGCDQGHANYIVNNDIISNKAFYSNSSGPVATVFYLEKIVFDQKFNLLNSKNEPYSIVHQYDKRWDKFAEAVSYIKKSLNILV